MATQTVQRDGLEAVSGLSVLLVEEDLLFRDQLAGILERSVARVLVAQGAADAPGLLGECAPDVCLVGLSGPDDAGFGALARIRSLRPEAVILAAVGLDHRGLVERVLGLDVDRVLARPVEPAILLQALARAASLGRRLGAARDSVHALADCLAEPALLAEEGRVAYANKPLLALLGHESPSSFVRAGARVGDHLEFLDGELWAGGEAWVDRVLEPAQGSGHLVTLRGAVTLRARVRPLPVPGLRLVLFSEVSGAGGGDGGVPRDPLTGVCSRSRFLELLADQERKASHGGSHYSLIMMDVDRLGDVNEACGRKRGDELLRELSRLVADNVRSSDILARWEGGRFAVLTPDSDYRRAKRVAERLRRKMEGCDFPGVDWVVTGSFGVGQAGPGEPAASLAARVDRVLGEAKRAGRNRVLLSSGE